MTALRFNHDRLYLYLRIFSGVALLVSEMTGCGFSDCCMRGWMWKMMLKYLFKTPFLRRFLVFILLLSQIMIPRNLLSRWAWLVLFNLSLCCEHMNCSWNAFFSFTSGATSQFKLVFIAYTRNNGQFDGSLWAIVASKTIYYECIEFKLHKNKDFGMTCGRAYTEP